jgi:Ca-activated chloride channel family protein
VKRGGLSLIGAIAVAAGLPCAAGAYQDKPSATFRSSVDVVSVTAVVRDRKGRFVRDLAREDFTVVEAGQRKPILDFRALSDGPVKFALLVDISGSMRLGSKAVDARQAAKHLFSAMRPGDEAAVFSFDTRLDLVRDFTSDVTSLEDALGNVEPPFGQTSLYDAVAETARAVAGARTSGAAPQRKAVVVLTDGIDTRSRLTPSEVSTIAGTIDVPVYVLAVMASVDDPRGAPEGSAGEISSRLIQLSRGTGGELFTATAPAHASVAARQIVAELRHQYVLAFEASGHSGWRPVEIRARDRDHIVRARSGYSGSG